MPVGETVKYRAADLRCKIGKHCFKLIFITAAGEVANDNSGTMGKCSGKPQLGERSFYPVGGFTDFFKDQEFAGSIRKVICTAEGTGDRNISRQRCRFGLGNRYFREQDASYTCENVSQR